MEEIIRYKGSQWVKKAVYGWCLFYYVHALNKNINVPFLKQSDFCTIDSERFVQLAPDPSITNREIENYYLRQHKLKRILK